MPIYEYRCDACGNDFEYLVLGGREPEACPACQHTSVCRLMSTCSFASKGSSGETVKSSASSTSCGGCAATSCSGCGH